MEPSTELLAYGTSSISYSAIMITENSHYLSRFLRALFFWVLELSKALARQEEMTGEWFWKWTFHFCVDADVRRWSDRFFNYFSFSFFLFLIAVAFWINNIQMKTVLFLRFRFYQNRYFYLAMIHNELYKLECSFHAFSPVMMIQCFLLYWPPEILHS